MTGRDLIIYILANGLEDQQVFEDGKFIGFMNINEAAVKFEVGTATVRVWVNDSLLPAIRIDETIYIPADAKCPREKIAELYKGVIHAKTN